MIPYCVGVWLPVASFTSNAIIDAVDKGARVIQLALSLAPNTINTAIAYARQRNVVIICASGNDYLSSVSYPASHADVIAVGATDRNNRRARFSNFGTNLDVVAPGVDIFSTTLNNGYVASDGTSLAAPQVSGIAALILSVNPNLTAQQVRNAIETTCNKNLPEFTVTQNRPNGTWNNHLGFGLVNAFRAVDSVTPRIIGAAVVPCSGTVTYTLNENFVGNWSVQTGLTIIGASQNVRSITVSRNPAFAPDSAFVSAVVPGIPLPFGTARKRLYIGIEAVTRIEGPTNIGAWEMGWYQAVPNNFHPGGNFAWSVTPSPSQMHASMATAHIVFGQEGSYTVMCRATSPCNQQFDPATLYVHVSHFLASSVQHNLTSGTLHIEINPVAKEESQEVLDFTYDIHLYDEENNMLRQLITQECKMAFDVADLPGGNYFLHIYDGVNEHPIVQLITIEEKS